MHASGSNVNAPEGAGSGSGSGSLRKIPISRLRGPRGDSYEGSGGSERRRVSHACEPCRQRKTKCDGKRPICEHCREFEITCYYGFGKRELAKMKSKDLETRAQIYENLLQEIQPLLDSGGQLAIQKAIAKSTSPTGNNSRNEVDGTSDFSFSIKSSPPEAGESVISAEVGSTGSLDHIVEDVNTFSVNNPTGFMGKSTEVAWINRVKEELAKAESGVLSGAGNPCSGEGLCFTTHTDLDITTYHLDDQDVSISRSQVDPTSLPSKDVADTLVDLYFTTVHPLFPILNEQDFMSQYRVLDGYSLARQSSQKFLAVLNLVFAIGETYADVVAPGESEREGNCTDYFIRARVLGALDGGVVFEIPNLQQIQALGLTGMYLLASNQTNRAWNVVGLAVRLAYGLGLHLHSDTLELDIAQKEMLARVWHSIYTLETTLCLMTGRPSAINDRDCSTRVPRSLLSSFDEEYVPDLYFSCQRKLAVMSADILSAIYSAGSTKRSWADVQRTIRKFSSSLIRWRSSLPDTLDFGGLHTDRTFVRQRLELAFRYYNLHILINRPCICQMNGRIPNESFESGNFNRNAAAACISSAREIIKIITVTTTSDENEPNPNHLISIAPWWCLLHYIVSAQAVILLEMTYQASHIPESQAKMLLEDSKRLIKWLKPLATRSLAARRCRTELRRLLKGAAGRIFEQFEDTEDDEAADLDGGGTGHVNVDIAQEEIDWEMYGLDQPFGKFYTGDFNLAPFGT